MGTDWRPLPNESKAPEDADLRRVVNSWPTLPEAIRAGIMAMVNAAGTR